MPPGENSQISHVPSISVRSEPYAFVCYAHFDSAPVQREIAHLQSLQIRCWYDEGITPGENWSDELAAAISEAEFIVFFVSNQSVKSRHCINEIQYGLSRSKPILVVHLEPTSVPEGLELALGTSQSIFRYNLETIAFSEQVNNFKKSLVPQFDNGAAITSLHHSESGIVSSKKAFLIAGFQAPSPDEIKLPAFRNISDAIYNCEGRIFKSSNDELHCVFKDPVLALGAAMECLKIAALSAGNAPVISVHTGLAQKRGADYFGPALFVLKQLYLTAFPGQLLVSEEIVSEIGDTAGFEGIEFRKLGALYDDGAATSRAYQVVLPELAATTRKGAVSQRRVPGNLPASINSFLGRQQEASDLSALIQQNRIVTVLGTVGLGKTQLAIEVARSSSSLFQHGVWFADLTSIERDSDIWPVIASSLALKVFPGSSLEDQVQEFLENKQALLLMDNCEHVLEQVIYCISTLAANCSSLSFLCTSRRPLNTRGEALFDLPPFRASKDSAGPDISSKLFVERARMLRREFNPSPDDYTAIAEICENLDYIPLAIEISAGQVRRLSLEKIREKSANPLSFRELKGRRFEGHQNTLRETIQWSYDLLSPASQTVLGLLAVFTGPFTEELAITCCEQNDLDRETVTDVLYDLMDASLLTMDTADSQRFRMLHSVQYFCREKLAEQAVFEAAEAVFIEIYLDVARHIQATFESEKEREALQIVNAEMANLRSAFDRALTRQLDAAAEMAASLYSFCYFHRGSELALWPSRVLEMMGSSPLSSPLISTFSWSPVLYAGAAGHELHARGNPEQALSLVKNGISVCAETGNNSRGWLYNVAGQIYMWTRHPKECMESHEKGMNEALAEKNYPCAVTSAAALVHLNAITGNKEAAEQFANQANKMSVHSMQPTLIGYCHFARGSLEAEENPDLAIREYKKSMEWGNMAGNHLGAQRTHRLVTDLKAKLADPKEALQINLEYLVSIPEHGATIYYWQAISSLLGPLSMLGNHEEVSLICGSLLNSPLGLDKVGREARKLAQENLGPETSFSLESKGGSLSLSDTHQYLAGRFNLESTR